MKKDIQTIKPNHVYGDAIALFVNTWLNEPKASILKAWINGTYDDPHAFNDCPVIIHDWRKISETEFELRGVIHSTFQIPLNGTARAICATVDLIQPGKGWEWSAFHGQWEKITKSKRLLMPAFVTLEQFKAIKYPSN